LAVKGRAFRGLGSSDLAGFASIFDRTNMANTPQAKKRILRNANRAEINGARISRIRSFVKKVETAIAGGDKTVAAEALKAAQPELARGVARGVMHKNTVARKMSRLSKRIAAL
jgi:small subunit ribosomal protein S20